MHIIQEILKRTWKIIKLRLNFLRCYSIIKYEKKVVLKLEEEFMNQAILEMLDNMDIIFKVTEKTCDENNKIVEDAYYLINKFNMDGKKVTNMYIQKLMYLFEAYYMNVYNETLYNCVFKALTFGPIALPLYEKFRKFVNESIELTEKDIIEGKRISAEKKELLDYIYEIFKDVSEEDLTKIIGMEDSPWKNILAKKENIENVGANIDIDKDLLKEWFNKIFVKQK